MAAQLLIPLGTRYGCKRQALTVTATEMAGCGCGVYRNGRVDTVNMADICGRFSGGCTATHGKGGNEVPICPDKVPRRYPGLHQKLVYRLPEYGQSPDSAYAALDGSRCRPF